MQGQSGLDIAQLVQQAAYSQQLQAQQSQLLQALQMQHLFQAANTSAGVLFWMACKQPLFYLANMCNRRLGCRCECPEAGVLKELCLSCCRHASGQYGCAGHGSFTQHGSVPAKQLHASAHPSAAHDCWLHPRPPCQCAAQGPQEWQGPPSHHCRQNPQACC